jgi:uncharacterized protein (TIGR03085 family)
LAPGRFEVGAVPGLVKIERNPLTSSPQVRIESALLPSESMTAVPLARRDRLALCDLLDELGPDAPTLDEGWTTADLASHLVARDRRPDSVPGLVVPLLAGWSEHVRHGILRRPYGEVVTALRQGPPRWSPLRRPGPDRVGNTHEFFVHYEDVRYSNGATRPSRPIAGLRR